MIKKFQEHTKAKLIDCCADKKIINENGKLVCLNFALIEKYQVASEYIDYHENRYRVIKKLIYQRKYHLENIINNICDKNGLSISQSNRFKIHKIFNEIDKILPQINGDRKRIISISYILKQTLKL